MKFFRNLPRLATRLVVGALALWLLSDTALLAGEADLAIPDLHEGKFVIGGQEISAWNLLFGGAWVIMGTLGCNRKEAEKRLEEGNGNLRKVLGHLGTGRE